MKEVGQSIVAKKKRCVLHFNDIGHLHQPLELPCQTSNVPFNSNKVLDMHFVDSINGITGNIGRALIDTNVANNECLLTYLPHIA